MIVYVDGKTAFEYNNDEGAKNSHSDNSWIPIPRKTEGLGIECRNNGGEAGMIASTTDGTIVTDDSWLCSSKFVKGWAEPGFQDSNHFFSSPSIATFATRR